MTFTVLAYRWGNLNDHHYLVAQTSDEARARQIGEEACDERAGKYGVVVYRWDEDGRCSQHAYYPSQAGEPGPTENEHLMMCQSLGSTVHEVVTQGVLWGPPVDRGALWPNVAQSVEVPPWLVDMVRERLLSCKFSELLAEHSRGNPPAVLSRVAAERKTQVGAMWDLLWPLAEAEVAAVFARGIKHKAATLALAAPLQSGHVEAS